VHFLVSEQYISSIMHGGTIKFNTQSCTLYRYWPIFCI